MQVFTRCANHCKWSRYCGKLPGFVVQSSMISFQENEEKKKPKQKHKVLREQQKISKCGNTSPVHCQNSKRANVQLFQRGKQNLTLQKLHGCTLIFLYLQQKQGNWPNCYSISLQYSPFHIFSKADSTPSHFKLMRTTWFKRVFEWGVKQA